MIEICVIVIDIEGIISFIDFVRDVFFFYVCKCLFVFVEIYGDMLEVQYWLYEVVKEVGIIEVSWQEIIEMLLCWIGEDCKFIVFKVLQGMIWKDGYEVGDY